MSKWIEEKIGNIGEVVTGNTPPTKNQELYGDRYKFIKATDICEDSRTVIKTEEMLSDEGFKKYKKSLLPKGTTCVVTIGTLGKKLCYTDEPCFTNQAINAIKQYDNYDSMFIYYQMKLLLPQVKFLSSGTASGRENVSKSSFSNIKMRFPDLLTQKHIADILSTYDDLIENNNKRIALLEKAAQELYKEWFVRFRFPGHENTKFVNGLPDGWKVKKLKEISDFTYGKMPNKNLICDIGYPIFSGYRISGYYPEYMYENKMLLLIARGVGGTGDIKISPPKSYVTNLAIVFLLKDTIYQPYLYQTYLLNNLRYLDTGAAQSQITIDNLKNVKAIIPVNSLLERFNEYVLKFDNQADMLKQKNQNLIKQRDLLLPRLMSGKLEV